MATQPVMMRIARPLCRSARDALWRQPTLQKSFADKPSSLSSSKPASSEPAFLPGSQSPAAPVKTTVPIAPGGPNIPPSKNATTSPATPSSSSAIPPDNVPLTPPPPPASKVQIAPPTSPTSVSPPTDPKPASAPPPPPPPSPPPAPPKQRFSRFRLMLYLILTSALGYGGAVAFALTNDNFHDFFTEYVPFGETAVLYFEERSFQKKFPSARHRTYGSQPPKAPQDNGNRVTIPSRSGLSWRVSDDPTASGSDVSQKGKHMSAVDAPVPGKSDIKNAQQDPKSESRAAQSAAVQSVKKDSKQQGDTTEAPPSRPAKAASNETVESKAQGQAEKAAEAPPQPSPATPSPKSDPRPPAISPIVQLSPLEIPHADEPLVQELVKIVNDLITVVNADSADASNKYYAPITKAKDSLASVGNRILALKAAEHEAAEERVKQAHQEFDEGAKMLLQRIETAQREDEARYKEEFEAEREKISQSYEGRLKAETERSQEVAQQRLKNELTEQAIEMKRKFIQDIQSLVESEREGRLSKIADLSSNVDNLTELTSNWNGLIDSNLATQKLQVAVDAVRSALSSAKSGEDRPRPFVREMAALKLVADNDAIVDAAIASINPSAYQGGIPSPPQLIDRFRRVASEVRKASLLPEEAGVASHAASLILSKVMFKKQGQPQGSDVESVLTRTETMLEEGDLDAAAREMNTLKGWAGVLAQDWLGDVRRVLEVRQALEVVETEARLQCLRVS